MKIKLYNTLARKKEEFKPIKKGEAGMYTCGPTVYGPGHIGHARSYVNFDLLKRMFLYNNYKVKHILNITDVHDDMIKGAKKEKITVEELADRYIPPFKKDLADLNIVPADAYPRVTEYISEIIEMVKTLIEKGYGYVEKDGSVYFDVSKFKNYGKLSGIKLEGGKTGTRVETDKYEREEATDFALWKGWKKGEPYWQSPWGKGRPGWHIECSVMANKYLGKTIDLHAGAMDLKFPHHENEIAQSEAASGVKFINYWTHAGLLEVESQKMSKSLGNIYTLEDIKKKGFDPLALRYLFLTSHYRGKLNFTWKSLEGAQKALNKLRQQMVEWKKGNKGCPDFEKKFLEAINNDLDMPKALAITWDLVKSDYPDSAKKTTLLKFDRVLGLKLSGYQATKPSKEIRGLVEEREKLRKQGKWKEADTIRKKIEKLGWKIEDTEKGSKLRPIQ